MHAITKGDRENKAKLGVMCFVAGKTGEAGHEAAALRPDIQVADTGAKRSRRSTCLGGPREAWRIAAFEMVLLLLFLARGRPRRPWRPFKTLLRKHREAPRSPLVDSEHGLGLSRMKCLRTDAAGPGSDLNASQEKSLRASVPLSLQGRVLPCPRQPAANYLDYLTVT